MVYIIATGSKDARRCERKGVPSVSLLCLTQQPRIGSYGSPHTAITSSLNVIYKAARPLEKAGFILLKSLQSFDLLSKGCQGHPRASLQRLKLSIHTFLCINPTIKIHFSKKEVL